MRTIIAILLFWSGLVSAACNYPESLDSIPADMTRSTPVNAAGERAHWTHHNRLADCIMAIQSFIGITDDEPGSLVSRIAAAEAGGGGGGGPIDLTADVEGILPPENGGTGVDTLAGLRSAIEAQPYNDLLNDIAAASYEDEDQLIYRNFVADGILAATLGTGVSITAGELTLSANLQGWHAKTAPTGDVVGTSDTQPLTNKTLGAGSAIDLGSDATGDILYRDSSGDLERLPIGSSGQVLTVDTGLPSWAAAAGGGPVTITKAADTTRTSTTTFAADPDLQFAMAAGDICLIKIVAPYYAHNTPDMKYQIDGPASPTAFRWFGNDINTGATTAASRNTGQTGQNTYNQSIALGSSVTGYGIITLDLYVHNGANSGTFSFQWAQAASDANDTTVLAGSYLEYRCQ